MAETVQKVWLCWVPGIVDGEGGLFRARSAGTARHLCYLNAREAGFELAVTDVRSRRAPEFDAATFRNGIMPKYVELPSDTRENNG